MLSKNNLFVKNDTVSMVIKESEDSRFYILIVYFCSAKSSQFKELLFICSNVLRPYVFGSDLHRPNTSTLIL